MNRPVLPAVFPRPTVCHLSAGCFAWGARTRLLVDEAATGLWPDAEKALGIAMPRAGIENPEGSLTVRILGPDDLDRLERTEFVRLGMDDLNRGSCLVEAGEHHATVAALSREGFVHGIAMLRQTVGGSVRPRRCFLFDRPHLNVRAVSLPLVGKGDVVGVRRLISAMAGLAYNTLIIDRLDHGLYGEGIAELRQAASDHAVDLMAGPEEAPVGLLDGLEGPATRDWEHVSRAPGTAGAALRYEGGLSSDEMARAGFPYQLAYAAVMLCDRDYDNFSWEKVHDLVIGHMPFVMETLGESDAAFVRGRGIRWLPIPLGNSALPSGYVDAGAADGVMRLCTVGGQADAFVFSHAILPPPAADAAAIGPVARYRVRYRDGGTHDLTLEENVNIARPDVRCGRRYDPLAGRFDVDRRMVATSSRAAPVRSMDDTGHLALSWILPWRNPRPEEIVDAIEVSVSGAAHGVRLVVDRVWAVRTEERT